MAGYEGRGERFAAIEDEYLGYTVRDPTGKQVGKVGGLLLDENDEPEYFGVRMGFVGTRSTLLPADACTVDWGRGFIEVLMDKGAVEDGPSFEDERGITPEDEREVRSYYGLPAADGGESRERDAGSADVRKTRMCPPPGTRGEGS